MFSANSSPRVQKLECECAETPRSRTVATSARTVPKQNQETVCTKGVKIKEEINNAKEQQTCTEGVHESVRPFTPGHYYIYPCSHCGGSHRHIAAPLPTLDENNCYSPGGIY